MAIFHNKTHLASSKSGPMTKLDVFWSIDKSKVRVGLWVFLASPNLINRDVGCLSEHERQNKQLAWAVGVDLGTAEVKYLRGGTQCP